jgi:hypothetical protein
VGIENVAMRVVVAAVSLVGVSLLRVVVVLPGVVVCRLDTVGVSIHSAPFEVAVLIGVGVYLLDTIGVWVVGGSLDGRVEVAHGRSFDTSAEIAGEIPADNAIPGHANDALDTLLSILEVLVHEKMEHRYNMPSLYGSSGSDTIVLPMNATTNH